MAKLATNVVLPGPDGAPFALYEGDEVPDWAKDEIGAHCLEGGDAADEDDDDDHAEGEGSIPPKAGRGSSVEAWAAYAEANGVTLDEGAKREDIIAACEAAGVPTE